MRGAVLQRTSRISDAVRRVAAQLDSLPEVTLNDKETATSNFASTRLAHQDCLSAAERKGKRGHTVLRQRGRGLVGRAEGGAASIQVSWPERNL